MTRQQEISMGAHTARPHETGPITVARIATTAAAVAVTGVVGAGTALAHDDGSGGDTHGDAAHAARTVDEASSAGADAKAEADRARAEARQTVRDALADVGLTPTDSGDGASTDPSSGRQHSRHDTSEPSHPSSGPRTTTQPIAASGTDRPTSDVPPAGETETVPIR